MDPLVLRPRKPTEIVDAAIEVYRRNPVHFMLLTTAVHAPWLILQIIFIGNAPPTAEIFKSAMIGLGTYMSTFLMSALVVQMASDLYLGVETDAFLALRRVGSKLPEAFIAAFIQAMLVVVGLVLFLAPAVYFSAIFFAVIPAIVLERKSLFAAFGRSAGLSRGLRWHILSALGLVFIIRFAIQIGAAIVVTLLPGFLMQRIAGTLVAIVVLPIVGISDALIYYDARIRREGFDIEMMARSPAPIAEPPRQLV